MRTTKDPDSIFEGKPEALLRTSGVLIGVSVFKIVSLGGLTQVDSSNGELAVEGVCAVGSVPEVLEVVFRLHFRPLG